MKPVHFRWLAVAGALGTLAMLALWPTLLAPSRLGIVIHGLIALPGLLALPGLIRGKPYTHAWSTMLVTGYMAYAAMEAYADPGARLPALLMLSAGALWFVASNLFVRGQRSQRFAE